MDNAEFKRLLETPRNLLTGLDKQRQFLLQLALRRAECIHPDCDRLLSQIDACEQGFDGYVLGNTSSNTFRCPDCKTPLAIVIPFVAITGAAWRWGTVRNRNGGVTSEGK